MRKRQFIGICVAFGLFCTIVGMIAHKKGYMKCYKDADSTEAP